MRLRSYNVVRLIHKNIIESFHYFTKKNIQVDRQLNFYYYLILILLQLNQSNCTMSNELKKDIDLNICFLLWLHLINYLMIEYT